MCLQFFRTFTRSWLQKFRQAEPDGQETVEEKYVVAKCIGCGQCEHGCPVKVKIKVKKKQ